MKNRILFALILGAQALILQAQTVVNPWQITLGANAVEFYERDGIQYQTGNDGVQFDNILIIQNTFPFRDFSISWKGNFISCWGVFNQVEDYAKSI